MKYARWKSLKKIYASERAAEISRFGQSVQGLFSESDLEGLPLPVRRYLEVCGFVGRKRMSNVQTHWKNVSLRRALNAGWMPISCEQFNSVTEPMRIAYMRGRLLGIFPFEGRDIYQAGEGNMLIRLMKYITVGDARGQAMNESSLVTLLAEAFLAPSYVLQDYIRWEEADTHSVRASIAFNGIQVSGTFFFNEEGLMERFVSEDRNMVDQDGTSRKMPWSAFAGDYFRQADGLLVPGSLQAVWHLEEGDFAYFKGEITGLTFDAV